ncbi:MAG: hypothetical protein AAF656_05635 [Planctomycetota bacterium]
MAVSFGAGCSDEPAAEATTAASTDWLLDELPSGDVVGVAQARQGVAVGDAVMVRGVIGGRREPMTPDAGLFVIMDLAVRSCADMGEDHCATPWDYCCEPSDEVARNAATVQVRDESGAPVALGAALAPLDQVVVIGIAAPGTSADALIIHAWAVVLE